MMLTVESMKDVLRARARLVENFLATCLDDREVQPRLKEAMRYSRWPRASGSGRALPEHGSPLRACGGTCVALCRRH